MKRSAFLAGISTATVATLTPRIAVAQVPVIDATNAYYQAQHLLQENVSNKIALQNDLQALQLVYGMIFDHQSALQLIWPAIADNLNTITQRWGNVSLLNQAGQDIVSVLASRYPTQIDTNGMLRSVMGSLQRDGINQVGQWLQVIKADHDLTKKELDRATTNSKLASLAQSAQDQARAQTEVLSAGVSIAGAQSSGIDLLNTQMAEVLNQMGITAAAQANSAQSSDVMVFGMSGTGSYHSENVHVTSPAQLQQVTGEILSVPVLQPAARAAFQKRTRP